jgi:hypothetical protein
VPGGGVAGAPDSYRRDEPPMSTMRQPYRRLDTIRCSLLLPALQAAGIHSSRSARGWCGSFPMRRVACGSFGLSPSVMLMAIVCQRTDRPWRVPSLIGYCCAIVYSNSFRVQRCCARFDGSISLDASADAGPMIERVACDEPHQRYGTAGWASSFRGIVSAGRH